MSYLMSVMQQSSLAKAPLPPEIDKNLPTQLNAKHQPSNQSCSSWATTTTLSNKVEVDATLTDKISSIPREKRGLASAACLLAALARRL